MYYVVWPFCSNDFAFPSFLLPAVLLLLVVALVRLGLTAPAALHQTGRVAEATALLAMQGMAMVAGAPLSSLAPRYVIMVLIKNSSLDRCLIKTRSMLVLGHFLDSKFCEVQCPSYTAKISEQTESNLFPIIRAELRE